MNYTETAQLLQAVLPAATVKPAAEICPGWQGVAVEAEAPSALVFVRYDNGEGEGWTVEIFDAADPMDPTVHVLSDEFAAVGWLVGEYLRATR